MYIDIYCMIENVGKTLSNAIHFVFVVSHVYNITCIHIHVASVRIVLIVSLIVREYEQEYNNKHNTSEYNTSCGCFSIITQ